MQFFQSIQKISRIVKRNDLAMGRAPSVRCPEGTRIVALYKPKTALLSKIDTSILSKSSNVQWMAGTVGAKPLMQNRFEYLVIFFLLLC